MTKTIEFENLKIPKMAKFQGLWFSNFEIQIFLSFLVSQQKKMFF